MKAGDHSANDRLNDFLGRASAAVRGVFHGPLTYASLIWEDVDWDRFDPIGVDHSRIKDRYAELLQPFLALGKAVVNTEFGMRTYRGAEGDGTLGFGVADQTRVVLHYLVPFVRERLNGDYVRDEATQARELTTPSPTTTAHTEPEAILRPWAGTRRLHCQGGQEPPA
jgi:hypothetical protein